MELSTDLKGDITELQCILAFTQRGYVVSIPYSKAKYDFIVDINGVLIKIQAKTSCGVPNPIGLLDSFMFRTKSVTVNTIKVNQSSYHKKDIDYFATIYNGDCFLIPVEECGPQSKTLRINPPLNGNVKNISFAKDYQIDNILSNNPFCGSNSVAE